MPRAKKKEAEAPAEAVTETVQRMPLSQLHPFEGHPFKVLDDDAMTETVESIRQMGVANPLIVRPDPDGGYEILPSERAKAYKMKLEALKHQGQRHDLTSTQVVEKLAAEQVGDDAGISRESVRRFVRLTELIPEILDMVDAMDYAQAAPSLSQAQRMKKKSQESGCTLDDMCSIMDEVKKDDLGQIAFKTSDLQKFFPKSYTPRQMSDTILRLLEQWQRRRQRDQQR